MTGPFTPAGDGWTAGQIPADAVGRHEVVETFTVDVAEGAIPRAADAADRIWHRPVAPPLPTEPGTVIHVTFTPEERDRQWRTSARDWEHDHYALRPDGKWESHEHVRTAADLAELIDGFTVVSRPVAVVAREVLDDLQQWFDSDALTSFSDAVADARVKWGAA